MLMNDKIMFDRYYCINSTKHCENEENIGALYFITSSHFHIINSKYCIHYENTPMQHTAIFSESE